MPKLKRIIMEGLDEKYPCLINEGDMQVEIAKAKAEALTLSEDKDILKLLFSCIDLTSLKTEDSTATIREFTEKVNELPELFPFVPQVAALCVYPVFAPVLKSALRDKNILRALVSAGFPSAQTFSDVKKLETRRAIDFGADEIDIVMSVGEFLEGNYEFVGEEIKSIKDVMGDVHLKVILETGALAHWEDVWMAGKIAMENGADFIKTSTGKQQPAATYEAAYVMLEAIKKYHAVHKVKVGFKPAGGISSAEDALVYYCLVKNILGSEWLNKRLFRIGASRLANSLITDIAAIEKGYRKEINYF